MPLIDLDGNAQEVDGHIELFGLLQTHGILFGGHNHVDSAVGSTLDEGVQLSLVEPMVVGVAAANVDMGALFFN